MNPHLCVRGRRPFRGSVKWRERAPFGQFGDGFSPRVVVESEGSGPAEQFLTKCLKGDPDRLAEGEVA